MADKITIEILADGTIKTTTDPISGQNHANADAFILAMSRLAGGTIRRVMRVGADLKAALHAHTHDGHTHSH
jgi:hypothetical protein